MLRVPLCLAVNVLAQLDFFEGHYHCLLNMEQGMLILHPDVLLSGGWVADWLVQCAMVLAHGREVRRR